MTKERATKSQVAAAVIIRALKRKNHQSRWDLLDALAAHDLEEFYFELGKRKIRDIYGSHALATTRDGHDVLYVLDPSWEEGVAYALEMTSRTTTESVHINQQLDWLAAQYGNKGAVRKARRYASNLVEEMEDLRAELLVEVV